jgi:hypothetical protein
MEACRKQGRRVAKVEQFMTHGLDSPVPGYRHDAFGFIDIVAIDPNDIVAIQACASGRAEHEHKILANADALAWLLAGSIIELWSWSKHKVKRGGKAYRWHARVDDITLAMFVYRDCILKGCRKWTGTKNK